MLDPEERDVMEKQKESNQKEAGGGRGGELPVPASNLQDQRQASEGTQSPRPISRAETLSLLRGQSTNRSWVKRNSGKWGPEVNPSRLSMSWSSTRRKGLKELLLQSSQASPTWLTPSPKESLSMIESQRGVEDPFSEVNSEELCLALDPLEHEWMLTVAQGDAESILNLLAKEPSLLSRRDFVTGFTVLHWLAKHGRHEDLIQVMSFAERNGCPTNVNVLTASGRMTPLHLAALQGHVMTLKILVGAFGANTNLRDHNGRKAWQYLHANAPRELKELLGATEEDLAVQVQGGCPGNTNNNCAPSRWGWMTGAFRTEYVSVEAARPGQRSSPMGSYFRNIFRQAVAFFQDH